MPHAMLAYWSRTGAITSCDGTPLPSGFVGQLVARIESELLCEGCTITERSGGGGSCAEEGIEDSGFMHQATAFDYQESQGRVEVVFVARDFQTSRGRVVGQLIVTVTQAR